METKHRLSILKIGSLISFLIALLTFPSQLPGESAKEIHVTIALGFIPNVQFSPYYVAIKKGYYAEAGINVKLEYAINTTVIQLVGSEKAEFGMADGESIILARAQELPVVSIMTIYQKFPIALFSLKEKGFDSLEKLKGKKIGIPGFFGSSYIGLRALIQAKGMEERDFKLEAIGFTQVAALSQGRVDAAIGYLANEPVVLREQGFQVDVLPVFQESHLIGAGLITHEKLISTHSDLVKRVVQATLRGLHHTMTSPDDAFEVALEFVPEAGKEQNRSTQKAVLREAIKLWQSPLTDQEGSGYSDPQAWSETEKILLTMKLISQKIDLSKAFTNQFLK